MSMIDLGSGVDVAPPRRGPSSTVLYVAMVVVAIVAVLCGMAIAARSAPTPPPAAPPAVPDYHRVELRIDGDGVGQLARVWDDAGERDVDTFGVTLPVLRPRAVLYTVQAGAGQGAQCVIMLDGTEVERERAEPLTVATCVWVA